MHEPGGKQHDLPSPGLDDMPVAERGQRAAGIFKDQIPASQGHVHVVHTRNSCVGSMSGKISMLTSSVAPGHLAILLGSCDVSWEDDVGICPKC